jgi:Ion channel
VDVAETLARALACVLGAWAVIATLYDGFLVAVLPGRAQWRGLPSQALYRRVYPLWRRAADNSDSRRRAAAALRAFGPLSSVVLIAVWAALLLVGFAALLWGIGADLTGGAGRTTPGDALYFSGVTLFTVGFGDLTPNGARGRVLAVIEGGTGFAFLAIVIAYIPQLAQAFTQREAGVDVVVARAGRPPDGATLLAWIDRAGPSAAERTFERAEAWVAAVRESHVGSPVLALYRAPPDREHWLTVFVALADAATVVAASGDEAAAASANALLAVIEGALDELSGQFGLPPAPGNPARGTPPPAEEHLDDLARRLSRALAAPLPALPASVAS